VVVFLQLYGTRAAAVSLCSSTSAIVIKLFHKHFFFGLGYFDKTRGSSVLEPLRARPEKVDLWQPEVIAYGFEPCLLHLLCVSMHVH
jgi:hypothetical protein